MDVGILRISDEIVFGESRERLVNEISASLFKKNILISNTVYCGTNLDNLKSSFDFLAQISKSIIVVCETNFFEKFKNFVCEQIKCKLAINNFAKVGIDNYFKNLNQPVTKIGVQNYSLPECARCILNSTSEYVGFIFNFKGVNVYVLPAKTSEAQKMFLNSVLPLLCKSFQKDYYTISLKTFAISQKDIEESIVLISRSSKIEVSYFTQGLVCEILIRFQTNIDRQIVDDFIFKIYERIGKYIFTDEGQTLQSIVCDILKVQNKTISIFEDATFGSISKSLINETNFENVMIEKSEIIATEKTQIIFGDINTDEETYVKNLMQNNVFESGACVVNLKAKQESDAYFIGVGLPNDLDVFKIKLTGDSDEINLKLNQTSFYYLIKKLKQKHF